MLHAVATHLHINLLKDRSSFGLFGRHSYTTVLVMKALNKYRRHTNHQTLYTLERPCIGELIIGGEDGEELGVGAVEELNGMWKVQYLPPWQILRN